MLYTMTAPAEAQAATIAGAAAEVPVPPAETIPEAATAETVVEAEAAVETGAAVEAEAAEQLRAVTIAAADQPQRRPIILLRL